MPTIQKPNTLLTFRKNKGTRLFCSGKSEQEALMKHLVFKTREVGHQISLDEANDSNFIIMVSPKEFDSFFESFEWAAEKAWECVSSGISISTILKGK